MRAPDHRLTQQQDGQVFQPLTYPPLIHQLLLINIFSNMRPFVCLITFKS